MSRHAALSFRDHLPLCKANSRMPMQEDLWLYTCLRILGVNMVLQRKLLFEAGYDDEEKEAEAGYDEEEKEVAAKTSWIRVCKAKKHSTTVAFHPAKLVKAWTKCLTRSMHKTLSVLDQERQ